MLLNRNLGGMLPGLLLALAGGCSDSYASSSSGGGGNYGAPVVNVVLADGVELEDAGMFIEVSEDSPLAILAVYGQHGGLLWEARGPFDVAALTLGNTVEIDVSEAPRDATQGAVSSYPNGEDTEPTTLATDGTLTFSLDPREPKAEGSVSVTPSSRSATFSGTFVLSCFYVPDGGEGHILDNGFDSPFCQPYAAWRWKGR